MLQSAIGIKNSSKHVMIGCYGITQFQKHFLTTRDKSLHLLSELLERWQIRLKRNIGGINISKSYGLYAENLLILRFCAENDIAVLHQRLHHFGSSTTVVPKFLAEIQITRDGKPHTVGYFKRFPASVGSLLRKGGSNARPMKPACIGKNGFPIDHTRTKRGERRTLAVVHHIGVSESCAAFQIIQSQTFTAKHNAVRPQPAGTKRINTCTRHGIIGQTGNKFRRNAEVRQRHCHISLTATICSNKFISLRKAAETGRSKP